MALGPFIEAARAWDARRVRKMLEAEPSLAQLADRSGRTALHHCAGMTAAAVGLPPEAALETAAALLDAGAEIDAVKRMSEGSEVFEARPLWYSVARGENLPLTRFLLERGADPDDCLWAACYRNDRETTRLLLDFGAAVDPVFHGETPFLFAVKSRRFECLDLLIAAGADPNFRDGKGVSALLYAVKKKLDVSLVSRLLEWGANPTLEDAQGETALGIAARMRDKTLINLLRTGAP